MTQTDLSSRKLDHIQLAFESQIKNGDTRFYYEPLMAAHPQANQGIPQVEIAGKTMRAPIWISSMTGGAAHAGEINRLLATVAAEFGLGMGLGSCRPVLEHSAFEKDFHVRKYIGNQPLFANLGIAQLEEIFAAGKADAIKRLVGDLEADGLIVHVNPMQEFMQPEGDRFSVSPLDTIKRVLDVLDMPVIVKEVGQGMGPESLKALAALPLEAIDYGAFGGTNFSKLENLRRSEQQQQWLMPLQFVGHTAEEMTQSMQEIFHEMGSDFKAKNVIVSGGIGNFLDGYYHLNRLPMPAVYGHAAPFLKMALEGEEVLRQFVEYQLQGLSMAYAYLKVK